MDVDNFVEKLKNKRSFWFKMSVNMRRTCYLVLLKTENS